MDQVAEWFDRAVQGADDEAKLDAAAGEVREFLKGYPAPGILV